jgi:hypothetical protein
LAGYAQPMEVTYDDENEAEISQFYELFNLGPQTIGGVVVKILFPLEDAEGRTVARMEQNPFVRYTGPTGDYADECEVEGGESDEVKTMCSHVNLVKFKALHIQ